MCGRFVASRPLDDIVEQFEVEDVRLPLELLPGPRFNVSPQDDVLAVRKAVPRDEEGPGERRLSLYRWGLVPSWAKSPSLGARSFNARAETLGEKGMFKNALARRRCIIPADAFYEWEKLPSSGRRQAKQPWCFRAADGKLLGFAGLYELWHDDSGEEAAGLAERTCAIDDGWLRTCTLITTEANSLMEPVHDRMPVVLQPEQYEAWLSTGPLSPDELHEVGNSRAEGPQLAAPLEDEVSA